MKTSVVLCGIAVCCLVLSSCSGRKHEKTVTFKTTLVTDEEKLGYTLGVSMAVKLKEIPAPFDFESFLQGAQDAHYGNKQILSPEEGKRVTIESWEREKKKREQERAAAVLKNLNDGMAFLQANKTAPNVITTESGLQYIVVKQGAGPKPTLKNEVGVRFTGSFIDGKVFDSSEKRKGPMVYPVAAAMPGVKEALLQMPVGSTWRLFLPPQLAYGEAGVPRQDIGPNMVLIFELELLSIEK